MQKDEVFKIVFEREDDKQFIQELLDFEENRETAHKISTYAVMPLISDRISQIALSAFDKITLLMEAMCWTSVEHYVNRSHDGTSEVGTSVHEDEKMVTKNECYFETPLPGPDNMLVRFVGGAINADSIPDSIRGIEVKDYNKMELINRGMTNLFGNALFVGIAYDQYLIWTEKYSKTHGQPYDFQYTTLADIQFAPRHELAMIPNQADILRLYLNDISYADRLNMVTNGLPGGNNEYINLMALNKFIPDAVQ